MNHHTLTGETTLTVIYITRRKFLINTKLQIGALQPYAVQYFQITYTENGEIMQLWHHHIYLDNAFCTFAVTHL